MTNVIEESELDGAGEVPEEHAEEVYADYDYQHPDSAAVDAENEPVAQVSPQDAVQERVETDVAGSVETQDPSAALENPVLQAQVSESAAVDEFADEEESEEAVAGTVAESEAVEQVSEDQVTGTVEEAAEEEVDGAETEETTLQAPSAEYEASAYLDADEVHQPTEGGDYTEHDEYPDEEDEFGDELGVDFPEEFEEERGDETGFDHPESAPVADEETDDKG